MDRSSQCLTTLRRRLRFRSDQAQNEGNSGCLEKNCLNPRGHSVDPESVTKLSALSSAISKATKIEVKRTEFAVSEVANRVTDTVVRDRTSDPTLMTTKKRVR